jgi:uncharacterized protein (TIGR02145 family)
MKQSNLKSIKGSWYCSLIVIAFCCTFFLGHAQPPSNFSYHGYTMGMTKDQVKNITKIELNSEKTDELFYTYTTWKYVTFTFTAGKLSDMAFSETFYKKKKEAMANYKDQKMKLSLLFGDPQREEPNYSKKLLPNIFWMVDSTEICLSLLTDCDPNLTFKDKHTAKTAPIMSASTKSTSGENRQINEQVPMIISSASQESGTFTDSSDGKVYKTVKIGTQIWMAENLAHKASNGCWAYNNDTSKIATYGYIYDWETAKALCPAGWHLPTDAEWTILTDYLGGEVAAGDKLKDNNSKYWNGSNNNYNSSGFSALPGSYRTKDGKYGTDGTGGCWWSSTEKENNRVWYRLLSIHYADVSRFDNYKDDGCSVRYVKDNDLKSTGNEIQNTGNSLPVSTVESQTVQKQIPVSTVENKITTNVEGTFTDSRDGKVYKTVTIGTQTWMAENLSYKPSSGNYWAYNNMESVAKSFGYLYDWETAKKVCPAGWHLPSDAEWTTLTDNLGGTDSAGGKLKQTYCWDVPNINATNSSGFRALPGGIHYNDVFSSFGSNGYWWTSSDDGMSYSWLRIMYSNNAMVFKSHNYTLNGLSVRCVKDNGLKSSGNELQNIEKPIPVINDENTFTDLRDNKTYKTVTIGTQTWMAENFAYKPSSGSFWAYDNDETNVATYGYLYNFTTAVTLCPDGWHLPNNTEWSTLTEYLGGESVAGYDLKEIGTTYWNSPNTGATNESDFTALPGGYRDVDGSFHVIGFAGYWWSFSKSSLGVVFNRQLTYDDGIVLNDISSTGKGYSVRYIKDK